MVVKKELVERFIESLSLTESKNESVVIDVFIAINDDTNNNKTVRIVNIIGNNIDKNVVDDWLYEIYKLKAIVGG